MAAVRLASRSPWMPEDLAASLALLGRAMVELRPMSARFDGLERWFCPHALGRDGPSGPWRAFVWQYAGETHGAEGALPAWRCFALSRLKNLRLEHGLWRRGEPTKGNDQHCLTRVEAAVGPEHTSADFSAYWSAQAR